MYIPLEATQTSNESRNPNGTLGREYVARDHTTLYPLLDVEHCTDLSGSSTAHKKGKVELKNKATSDVYTDEAGPTTIHTMEDGHSKPIMAGGTDECATPGRVAKAGKESTFGATGGKVTY